MVSSALMPEENNVPFQLCSYFDFFYTSTLTCVYLCVFTERDIESQVLQSECRRMEAQHYHLSVTADQLSVSMGVRS